MVSMRSLLAYFWVDRPRVIYFVLCCGLVLLLAWKRRDAVSVRLRRYIVLPSAVLLVLLLNPVVAHFLVTKYEETRSLRFFWLIPVSLLMAAASVLLVDWFRPRALKIAAAIVLPLGVLATVNQFHSLRNTWQNHTTNWYKVPDVVIELADTIMQDDAGVEKKAFFPTPLNLWVRQYCPGIEMPYAWSKVNGDFEPAQQIYDTVEKAEGAVDLDQLAYWAAEGGYHYLVLAADGDYTGSVTAHGFAEIYRIDVDPVKDTNSYDKEYVLYRLAEGAYQ